MTKREMEQQIEELQRRVRDLEARPIYVPYQVPVPMVPHPFTPPYPYVPPSIPYQSPFTVACSQTAHTTGRVNS